MSSSSRLRVGDDPYADMIASMISRANGIIWQPGESIYSDQMIDAIQRFSEQFREGSDERETGTDVPGVGDRRPGRRDDGPLRIPSIDELENVEMPSLDRLTGELEGEFAQWMREGEDALTEDRFFEAERAFSEALSIVSNYPLALAGKAHSQLGAGLYRSAALSLRNLLTRHPEMAFFEFDESVMPSQGRLTDLLGTLRILSKRGALNDDGLLLAYTGRLAGDEAGIREGVNLLSPDDPLLPLLRRAWLRESDQQKDEPGTEVDGGESK